MKKAAAAASQGLSGSRQHGIAHTRLPLHLPLLLCLLMSLLMLLPHASKAQDPQLSQFFAAPLYLNPALTGTTYEDRIAGNYRLQWTGLPKGYETYAFSYDHNSSGANSGYGGFVMHDQAGSLGLAFTHAGASYAYAARIDRHRTLRVGLRLGWTTREIGMGNALFADQVIRDNAPSSVESGFSEKISYFDAAFGALYHTEQFWLGASFSHINRPQQSLINQGDVRLPMRTTVNTGYKMPVDGKPFRKSESFITLAAYYKSQLKWDQLDVGAYLEYKRLCAGLWYRGLPGLKAYAPGYPNDDAVILMAGFETTGQLRIVYSYDITISWLTPQSGGAHELSLQYEWPKRAKNRKYHAIPCPKF